MAELRITDPMVQQLLEELIKEGELLQQAEETLRLARARYGLASARYAAVRDEVSNQLQVDPYTISTGAIGERLQQHRKFRFMDMAIGDAVKAVLREQPGEPMSLEEIVALLRGGGLRAAALARSVNAALMQTTGVQKTEEGKYRYEEVAADELPF